MFDNITIGDYFLKLILTAIQGFIAGKYSSLADSLHTFISIALICSIVIYGIKVMAGDFVATRNEMLITILWVLIAIPLTEPQTYYNFIFTTFYDIKVNITEFLLTGNLGKRSIYEVVGRDFFRIFLHASNMTEVGGVDGYITAAAIYIIYGVYYLLFISITLYVELVIGIILLLGGVIIPLSAFQSTRGLLKSWLLALFKYMTFFFVVAIIMNIINHMTHSIISELIHESYLQEDEATPNLNSPTFGAVLLAGTFGGYLMLQAMEIAVELTGGVMSDGARGATALQNSAKNSFNSLKSSSAGVGFAGSAAGKGMKAIKSKFGKD